MLSGTRLPPGIVPPPPPPSLYAKSLVFVTPAATAAPPIAPSLINSRLFIFLLLWVSKIVPICSYPFVSAWLLQAPPFRGTLARRSRSENCYSAGCRTFISGYHSHQFR